MEDGRAVDRGRARALPSDISLRPADENDASLLLELMSDLYAQDRLAFDPARAHRALLRILENPQLGRVWLIEHGARVTGYVVFTLGFSLEFHGVDAFVDELYLRPEFRGRGIGTIVLERIMDLSRGLGIEAVHLEVERANTRAQLFYRRAGFQDHDRYLMTRRVTPKRSDHEA